MSSTPTEKAPVVVSSPAGVVNKSNIAFYAAVLALAAFPLGWDVGSAGHIVALGLFKELYKKPLVDVTGMVVACFNLGGLLGSLFLSKAAVSCGPKIGLYTASVVYGLGSGIHLAAALIPLSPLWAFIIGRTLCGTACGAFCVVGPIFIAQTAVESTPFYVLQFQAATCVFIVLGNGLFYALAESPALLVVSYAIQLSFLVLFGVFLIAVPQSMVFQIQHRNYHGAGKTLRRLYKFPSRQFVAAEMVRLVAETELLGPRSIRAVFQNPTAAKTTLKCCLVMVFQQLTGINYFFYYGSGVFQRVFTSNSARNWPPLAMAAVNLAGALASGALIVRAGNRPLLVAGSSLMAFFLALFAVSGSLLDLSPSFLGPFMVVVTCLFILVFATTWGPVVGVLNTQLSGGDETIVGIAVGANWVANFAVGMVSPALSSWLGFGYGVVFCGCTLVLIPVSVWVTKEPRKEADTGEMEIT